MRVAVMTKARIGFAIAVGVLLGVGEAEISKRVDLIKHNVAGFCGAVAGAGFLMWLAGQVTRRRDHAAIEHPLGFLTSLRYWALILIVSTAGFYSRSSFGRLRFPSTSAQKRKAESFPKLDLQGLVVNGARSSALINGQVLFIGEGIGRVQLLAVDSEHATVGLDGQTKVLSLRR